MVAVPLHTAFRNGCLMRILGNAWISFFSCATNSAEVATLFSSLLATRFTVLMGYWNIGIMENNTPSLQYSIIPFFFSAGSHNIPSHAWGSAGLRCKLSVLRPLNIAVGRGAEP